MLNVSAWKDDDGHQPIKDSNRIDIAQVGIQQIFVERMDGWMDGWMPPHSKDQIFHLCVYLYYGKNC